MTRKTSAADRAGRHFDRPRTQSKDELASLLDELAERHPDVEARLARHALRDDPAALAAQFREQLARWKRTRRFRPRGEAAVFGRELMAWLDAVQRELLPADPVRAHALADAFVKSDHALFDQADDSDAAIGDVVRDGCRLWLVTAKARNDRPPSTWIDRIYKLHAADQYGAREALLRHADVLLAPPELRALATRFEDGMERALAGRGSGDELDYAVFKAAAALSLVADALRDPDLAARATLRYSPDPNELQREQIAERYVRFDRPKDALRWLDGNWGTLEDRRLRLLAQVHAALGDARSLRAVRRTLFDRSGATADFEAWRASLAPDERAGAYRAARERVGTLDDRIAGAQLLLAIGDPQAAEALLVEHHATVRGEDYGRLLALAETMLIKGRLLGVVVCHRALLNSILERANATAYGHAAKYLARLRELSAEIASYGALATHDEFEASLRSRHARKHTLWRRVGTPWPR